ncbi:U-box domain-containing protein 33 [Nymphaea thermarum]|nr:U-box domain-containing protein 33 [Nymphaea thermarum]
MMHPQTEIPIQQPQLMRKSKNVLERRSSAKDVISARQADRLRNEAEERAEKMAKKIMEMESKITELRNENASLRTCTAGLEQEVEIKSQELKEAMDERQKTEIQIAVLDHDLRIESEKLQETVEELAKLRREGLQTESFIEFTLDELRNATHGFDENLVIGAGGFGTVYKGQVHYTAVAIKKLNPGSTEGAKQFKQEILALTKLRHPHLVTLIGACSEEHCLVYELLINGSLEDRLFSNHEEQIFWWKDRLRVAAEVCLGLLFLHSNSMVHGDVKPANILLDAYNKAKIADFGICRFLPKPQRESTSTVCKYTDPRGTKVYMDPEFMSSGKLTYKSDVYAFGIILMQLLTKKPGFGLPKEVGKALNNNALHKILDHDAGNWPMGETSQLANLALQCCELRQKCRPDLEKDVWKILQRYL